MEILKFKKNTWCISSCYSASATAIESYWGGGGGGMDKMDGGTNKSL